MVDTRSRTSGAARRSALPRTKLPDQVALLKVKLLVSALLEAQQRTVLHLLQPKKKGEGVNSHGDPRRRAAQGGVEAARIV